ncbi:MAG: HEPN domain-containing protein [Deltaproteobacteria bacterium]|nr:HEPN domain-containing protein [Deltaproteobacteria bacterium]
MTDPLDSPNFGDWLVIARKDRGRIDIMLEEDDVEAAAFFLQQSLEKHLKAFLLKNGWKLKKVHELDALLDDASKFDNGLERFRDLCERVSGYYFAERYPPLGTIELTREDIEKDVGEAGQFIACLFPEEE